MLCHIICHISDWKKCLAGGITCICHVMVYHPSGWKICSAGRIICCVI